MSVVTTAAPAVAGLDLGARRLLRPGPLRWLRASGWALALFVVFLLAYAGVGLLPHPAFARGEALLGLAQTAGLCVAALALYVLLVRLGEGRWPSELAVGPAALELTLGLAIGAAMMCAVVGLLFGFGLYDIAGPRPADATRTAAMALSSGVLEELIMRAILMRLMMRAFGAWPALLAQAALFGALHLGNANADLVAAAAIALEAGLMLGAFYLLTGRLWLPIGVHAAWNFTQGWVWGAAVSGGSVDSSLFASAPRAGAPDLLSGGAFGPEASLPAVVIGTGAAMVVLVLAARKGHLRARPDAAAG